jgi:beta-lactamase regulating signal transducer with metallopeptidase domain
MFPMHTIAQIAAEGIVSSLVLGMAVAVIAWLLARVLPSGKAGLRFAVWFSALGAIALVPVVQNLLQAGGRVGMAQGTVRSLLVLPANWAWYLFGVWATVAMAGVTRVGIGALHLWKLRAQSTAVETGDLNPVVRPTVERAEHHRRFEVRVSDQVNVPMAIGFLRPAIVFPRSLLSELSPEQVNQLVLHESTHLLRYDDWTNLLQKLIQAVLFFHPAVWWLENKLTLEREMACDEAVVDETRDARSYAECLATLAEKSALRRSLALVQAAVSRLRHTSFRVEQVLALDKEKRNHVRGWGAAASVVGVISCAAVLVQAPDLVSFQNKVVAENESEAVMAQESGARVVPAMMKQEVPKVIPAMMKQAAETELVRANRGSSKGARLPASRREFAPFEKRADMKARVVMASQQTGTPVPVLVTTTMLIESDQSGVPNQLWVVRMWRIALYYPAAEQSKQVPPRKI